MSSKNVKDNFRSDLPMLVVCAKCKHSNTFRAFDIENELILKCAECGHIYNTKRKWKGKLEDEG